MTFVADGPKRFLLGSLFLLLGGISLLVAQQVYEPPPPPVEKNNGGGEETTSGGVENDDDESTAITAVILCSAVIFLAFFAIAFLIFVIRMIKYKDKQQMEIIQQRQADIENKNNNKNIFERFLYPDFPSSNNATINDSVRLLAKRRTELFREVSWNNLSRILLMAPSVALFLVFVVRLFLDASNFEAVPYYLDFGWKYGLLPHNRTVEKDGDALYNEPAEKSIAYTVELTTYGHAIQGFLSSFLAFPTIYHFLIRTLTCTSSSSSPSSSSSSTTKSFCFVIWKNLILLAPWALTIYPTYNLVKRYIKAGEAFAGSSFANNGFEWSSGSILGMATGNLVTSVVLFRRISTEEEISIESSEDNSNPSSNNVNSQQKQNEETSSPPWWKFWEADKDDEKSVGARSKQSLQENPNFCIRILQVLLGLLLLFTCFAGSILFGTTWHGCLNGSPDECVNYSVDGGRAPLGIFISYIIIPSVVFLGAILF